MGYSKSKSKQGDEKSTAQRQPGRKSALVRKMIETIEGKLKSNDIKASLGDFIRLLQLEKELDEEQPKEIRVKWVEPSEEEESASET